MGLGEMDQATFTALLESAMRLAYRHAAAGSVHYWAMGWRHVVEIGSAGQKVYDRFMNMCVWRKNQPGIPARTTQEFIAAAKARRNPVTYGTPGVGSSGHIAAEAFAQAAGLRLEHAPYCGGAEAANALPAGDIDAACITLSSASHVVEAGRAQLVGVTGARRTASHPGVPPLAEGGLPGFDFTSWSGLFGPSDMPEGAVRKIVAALQDAGTNRETMRRLAASGFEAAPNGPADFAAQVARTVRASSRSSGGRGCSRA